MKLKPFVHLPIVDKIANLLACATDPDQDADQMLADVRQRLTSAIEHGRCEYAYPRGQRYKLNFNVLLGQDRKVLVQIGALQARQKGGMRVCLNPNQFEPGDVQLLHRALRRIVGRSYYSRLMMTPLLNVLHIAVDIENVCLSRTLVRYKHGQRMTVFGKVINQRSGRVETMNFGSVTSDYQTAVYDKRTERIHDAIQKLNHDKSADDPLKANRIRQLKTAIGRPLMIRVEVRGQKLHGRPLRDLGLLRNDFTRFQFMSLASGRDDPHKPMSLALRAFIAMVYQFGLKPALAAFKHTKSARAVHRLWRERQRRWWKPENLWSHVPDAVRATGLFPPRAFGSVESDAEGLPAHDPRARRRR